MDEVLGFNELAQANAQRIERWHWQGLRLDRWSAADWVFAMAGEARRVSDAMTRLRQHAEVAVIKPPGRQFYDKTVTVDAVGKEIADIIIYLDLFATKCGLSAGAEVINKFNATSRTYGFPERLGKLTSE